MPISAPAHHRPGVGEARHYAYGDVTNVLAFLASGQASCMTGQAINVTGGQQVD